MNGDDRRGPPAAMLRGPLALAHHPSLPLVVAGALVVTACTDYDAGQPEPSPLMYSHGGSFSGGGAAGAADAGATDAAGVVKIDTWAPPHADAAPAGDADVTADTADAEDTAPRRAVDVQWWDAGPGADAPDAGATAGDGGGVADVPPPDTGGVDTAGPDAGTTDATGGGDGGPSEAGAVDSGAVDAGPSDAGGVDSGAVDAGPSDAGGVDSGAVDAGPSDTGPVDTGPVDTGPVDAGPVDTGPVDAGPWDAAGWDAPDVAPWDGAGYDAPDAAPWDGGGLDAEADAPEPDGLGGDAPVADVQAPDAGQDVALVDVGSADGGQPDAGLQDVGAQDAGPDAFDAGWDPDWGGYGDVTFPDGTDIYGGAINSCFTLYAFVFQEACKGDKLTASCVDQGAKEGSAFAQYQLDPLRKCAQANCVDKCAGPGSQDCVEQCLGKRCAYPFFACITAGESGKNDCADTFSCLQKYEGMIFSIANFCFANATLDAQKQVADFFSCGQEPQTDSCVSEIAACWGPPGNATCAEAIQCSEKCPKGDDVCGFKCIAGADADGRAKLDKLWDCTVKKCGDCQGPNGCGEPCYQKQCAPEITDCILDK